MIEISFPKIGQFPGPLAAKQLLDSITQRGHLITDVFDFLFERFQLIGGFGFDFCWNRFLRFAVGFNPTHLRFSGGPDNNFRCEITKRLRVASDFGQAKRGNTDLFQVNLRHSGALGGTLGPVLGRLMPLLRRGARLAQGMAAGTGGITRPDLPSSSRDARASGVTRAEDGSR